MTLSDEIAAVSAAVAATSVAIGVWQYRRTVHRDIFRVYADKYNTILQPAIYDDWQAALHGDSTKWQSLTPTMVAYLNLIWEECFLARERVIPRSLWRLWAPEIRRVFCSQFAQDVISRYEFHFPENLTCGSKRLRTQIHKRT